MNALPFLLALSTAAAGAQTPAEQLAMFDRQGFARPIALSNQRLRGAVAPLEAEKSVVLGTKTVRSVDGAATVVNVAAGSPAERAGVRAGDSVLTIDGSSVRSLSDAEIGRHITSRGLGATVHLELNRAGKTIAADVVTDSMAHVWPAVLFQEARVPPAVSQSIFGGLAQVTCQFQRIPDIPNAVNLNLFISNTTAPSFAADQAKFFVLDGTGQQLHRVSLEEIKYSIELQVARNWHGGDYPPPQAPSPTRQYTVQGFETGNFSVMSMGGQSNVSGTATSTYLVTPAPDYGQLGSTLGLVIRQWKDRKANDKLLGEAKGKIAYWESVYFRGTGPVIGGEKRNGTVRYWTGSARPAQPPFTVVLFLTNPQSQIDERLAFAFGDRAETLRTKLETTLASDVRASSPVTPPASVLRNNDIIDLVKAGLSVDVIIAKVKVSRTSFDTSPAALASLKRAGVPDSAILAMVQAIQRPD